MNRRFRAIVIGVALAAFGLAGYLQWSGGNFSFSTVVRSWAQVFQKAPSVGAKLTVRCSSELPSEGADTFACDNALPDHPGDWASDGQRVGAWIMVLFDTEVDASGVWLYDRGPATEVVTDGHFEFSDGTRYPSSGGGVAQEAEAAFPNALVTFKDSDGAPVAKRTTSIKFVIDAVGAATANPGLAEISPVFTVPEDSRGVPARGEPKKLQGIIGITRDDDGSKPLVPHEPGEYQIGASSFSVRRKQPPSGVEGSDGVSDGRGVLRIQAVSPSLVISVQRVPILFSRQDVDPTSRGVVLRDGITRLDSCSNQRSAVRKWVEVPSGTERLSFRAWGVAEQDGGMRILVDGQERWQQSFFGSSEQEFGIDLSGSAGKVIVLAVESFATGFRTRHSCNGEFVHFKDMEFQGVQLKGPVRPPDTSSEISFSSDDVRKGSMRVQFFDDGEFMLDSCRNRGAAVSKTLSIPPNASALRFFARGSRDIRSGVATDGGLRVLLDGRDAWSDTLYDAVYKEIRVPLPVASEATVEFESFGAARGHPSSCYGEHVYITRRCFVDASGSCVGQPSAAPKARLIVEPSSARPSPRILTSETRGAELMQYRLSASEGDVKIRSLPIALSFNGHTAVSSDIAAIQTLGIWLGAAADGQKKKMGDIPSAAFARTGWYRLDMSATPLVLAEGTTAYLMISLDLSSAVPAAGARLAVGLGDGDGDASSWAEHPADLHGGGYGIDAVDARSGVRIDPLIINSSGEAAGSITASNEHLLKPGAIRAALENIAEAFVGALVEEPVLRFTLEAQGDDVDVFAIEWSGRGTCNNGLALGDALLRERLSDGTTRELYRWQGLALDRLVYRPNRGNVLTIENGQSRSFELTVTTACEPAQTIQYTVGRSGIQWRSRSSPSDSADMDGALVEWLPLVGPERVAVALPGGGGPSVIVPPREIAPEDLLRCSAQDDRPSLPLEIRSVAIVGQPITLREDKTLRVRISNRVDIAQWYDLQVEWGDGDISRLSPERALPGSRSHDVETLHTFRAPASAPLEVRAVEKGGNTALSGVWGCPLSFGSGSITPKRPVSDQIRIVPGHPTSIGMIFSEHQTISKALLSVQFGGYENNRIELYSAPATQQYRQIPQRQYTLEQSDDRITVTFSSPVSARFFKILIRVDDRNAAGAEIRNASTALELFSP